MSFCGPGSDWYRLTLPLISKTFHWVSKTRVDRARRVPRRPALSDRLICAYRQGRECPLNSPSSRTIFISMDRTPPTKPIRSEHIRPTEHLLCAQGTDVGPDSTVLCNADETLSMKIATTTEPASPTTDHATSRTGQSNSDGLFVVRFSVRVVFWRERPAAAAR